VSLSRSSYETLTGTRDGGRQALERFSEVAQKAAATSFVDAPPQLSSSARAAAEVLYKHVAASLSASSGGERVGGAASSVLPVLYTEGFAAEQVWQQLCLQYGPLVARSKRLLKKVRSRPLCVWCWMR
jgi:hypothetical protein